MTYQQALRKIHFGCKVSRQNYLWNECGNIIYKNKNKIVINDYHSNEKIFIANEDDKKADDFYIVDENYYNLQMSQFRLSELEYGCAVSYGSKLFYDKFYLDRE